MFRGIIALSLTALAFVFSASPARAAFQITMSPQQATLQASGDGQMGQIGWIDVLISSDSSDRLFATAFTFRITGNSNLNALTFLNLADVPNPADPLLDQDYVFSGVSYAAAEGKPLGSVDPLFSLQQFDGGDNVLPDPNADPIVIPSVNLNIGDKPKLLARLYVQAGPLSEGTQQANFTIGFDAGLSSLTTPDFSSVDSSVFNASAEVTVVRGNGNGASVTPVPPSLLLALSGAVTAGLAGWVSRRWKIRLAVVG